MSKEQLILNIGRIERALSRIERYQPSQATTSSDPDLSLRHEKLKTELHDAIIAIDSILAQEGD